MKPALTHLVSCKLVEFEADGRRKLVRTTEQGVVAFRAYENALALLEGRRVFLGLREAIKSLGRRSENGLIEQKDRTILPSTIMLG